MSDTVYAKDGLYVTRYWGGKNGDCVQITVRNPEGYTTMTLAEFRRMVRSLEKNVKETKDAWWHHISKQEAETEKV